jgi:two-component system phosphate regulon response regulator OmpR
MLGMARTLLSRTAGNHGDIRWRSKVVRILVIEDDAEARTHLLSVLSATGSEAKGYDTLCEAVRAMMRERYDLLILDLHQPGLPCETTLSLLREVAPDMPVVYTTPDPIGRQAARGARAGVFRVLRKPFDPTELLAAVEEARTLRGGSPA